MRLRKSWEFKRVKKNGKRFKDRPFWLQVEISGDSDDLPKRGIIASRRFGGAIQRNQAKRRLREIFRKNIKEIPAGSKIVIMPRPHFLTYNFKELEKRFLSALIKTSSN